MRLRSEKCLNMVDQKQKDSLFKVLELFQELGISKHVVLIGSWAEYFYDEFFSQDYFPNIATKDIDLAHFSRSLAGRGP